MANIIFSFPDLVTWITRITWFMITLTTLQCLRETNSHRQTVKYIEYCKKQTCLKFYYYQIVFAE
jgi:hypothetical protein